MEHIEPNVPAVIAAKTVTPMGGEAFYKELVTWLNAYARLIDALTTEAEVLIITDEVTSKRAIELAAGAKKTNRELEKARKALVDPPNELVNRVNALFKIYSKPLTDLENDLKNRAAAYAQKARAQAQRAALAAQKAAIEAQLANQKPTQPLPPVPPAPARTVTTDMGKATTRKRPKFEVINENEVPRPYLSVDQTKLRQAIVGGGVREIPGVRIWEEEEINLHV